MPLDPQAEFVLSMMPQDNAPMSDDRLADIRTGYSVMVPLGVGDPVAVASAVDHDANGVAVRVFVPNCDQPVGGYPAVVFIHGGGWAIGTVNDYDALTRLLCAESEAVVISVDYRLAPEHPYPAAPDDCWTALQWVADNANELGIDGARIAVGGDSAGGNLSAVIAQRARDEQGPNLVLQALLYPVVDSRFDRPSYSENATGYFLEATSMEYFFDAYCRGGTSPTIAGVAPLRNPDLSNLAPALVITAEFDPLRDEGNEYAAALAAAGVAVETTQYAGMIHGFFSMPAVLNSGRDAFTQVVRALRTAFGTV